jgi:hypothetical protein
MAMTSTTVIAPSVTFIDTAYYPNWLYQAGYDPNAIGEELNQIAVSDRNASWMKYRGHPVKHSKFFYYDPNSMGDIPIYPFTGFQYESVIREYRPISQQPLVTGLRQLIEQRFGFRTNHVIGTKYYNQDDTVGWHQDKVEPLQVDVPIFIFSFYDTRPLSFRDATTHAELGSILMESGSLLVLGYQTNRQCQHAILPTSQPVSTRLSISFRAITDYMSYDTISKRAKSKR